MVHQEPEAPVDVRVEGTAAPPERFPDSRCSVWQCEGCMGLLLVSSRINQRSKGQIWRRHLY